MAGLGVSFVPSGEQGAPQEGQPGAGGAPVSPLQRAIQLLSLRLPRFGGQGISPGAMLPGQLLQGQGGSGLSGILQQLLQQGGGQPNGSPAAAALPVPGWTFDVPGGGGPDKNVNPPAGPLSLTQPPSFGGGVVPPGSFQPSPSPGMGGPNMGGPRNPRVRQY